MKNLSFTLMLAALTALLISSPLQATTYPAPSEFVAGTYTGYGSLSYMLFKPKPANFNPALKYPLVIFLHGAGEVGGSNGVQLNGNANGSMIYVASASPNNQQSYPCFFVAPHLASGAWVDATRKIQIPGMIDQLLNDPTFGANIDPDRIYITGLSYGGSGTWVLAIDHPELYAAAIPMSGNSAAVQSLASSLATVPTWTFHALNDPNGPTPPSNTENMVKAMRTLGLNPTFTETDSGGHGPWSTWYSTPALVPWTMAQIKDTKTVTVPGVSITSPTNSGTYATPLNTLNMSGTVVDSTVAATQVLWNNNQIAFTKNGLNGIANGTTTFTSAGGGFSSALVGQRLDLGNKGVYTISSASSTTLVVNAAIPAGNHLLYAVYPATIAAPALTLSGTTWTATGLPLVTGTNQVQIIVAGTGFTSGLGGLSSLGQTLAVTSDPSLASFFSQDFSSSSTVSDYVNAATLTDNLFSNISAEADGGAWSIDTGKLKLVRPGISSANNGAGFTRFTEPLAGAPTVLEFDFKLALSGVNTFNVLGDLVVGDITTVTDYNSYVANGLITNRLFFQGTGNGIFKIGLGTASSANLSANGTDIAVSWFLNNSGSTQTYFGPDSVTHSLNTGCSDLWANGVLLLNNIARPAGSTGTKLGGFRFSSGTSQAVTFKFDEFSLYDSLP
jgi:poly(3-hydroxybutyrate) depolymerase